MRPSGLPSASLIVDETTILPALFYKMPAELNKPARQTIRNDSASGAGHCQCLARLEEVEILCSQPFFAPPKQ